MRPDADGVFRYGMSKFLPVPWLDYSADELFDGFKTFDKLLSLEILTTHVRALETRVDVAEETDIVCPSSFAEQFIAQLLPHSLPSCIVNDITDSHSLVKTSSWLEDTEANSLIVVREIEAYMLDLPDACWRFNKSLNEDILEKHFNFVKELECLKAGSSSKLQSQYAIEPGQLAIPLKCDGGCKEGGSVQETLPGDGGFVLKIDKSMHHNSVKNIELKSLDRDSPLDQYSDQSMHNAKIIGIQNLVRRIVEPEIEEPTELLDFDSANFLLEKLQFRPNTVLHKIQGAESPSSVVNRMSWLDEKSVAADKITAPKHAAMKTLEVYFELPQVLEDEYLGHFSETKLGSYISTSLIKPNIVELEDLDSRNVAFQYFEKILVLPELALQTASFHFLQVPSFIEEHQACVTKDGFKGFFRAKALPSPTSASDWLYLDWHLSQIGHCNNYGCFRLQRRLLENELSVTFQRDMISGKRMTDFQLLLGLSEDSLPWNNIAPERDNTNEFPAAKLHASVSTSMLNFSNFTYTADKVEDKNYSDQSVLTDEPRICTENQVPLAGSSPTSMESVLSLMKQARQGVLSGVAKSMQASAIELHQEVYQCTSKNKNQPCDLPSEDYKTLETASTSVTIPRPNPLYSTGVDNVSNYSIQTSSQIELKLLEPFDNPACLSQELLQIGYKSAPTSLVLQELNQLQSEMDVGLGPHLIVVANILQPDGSVLLQRRNSYQKILGLENEDLQVVERELILPVDLILNPSTCLTIYTEEKLLGSANICSSNPEEFFSCVMDTVVDFHMKALSFSFQRWFMIFEGELAFNSAISNILNKLYICSAGFEMRVQGFISANSMTTDSLVLRCIKKMWKMSERPFDSPMSEDLTDGEICLATFPSLNPLSSHAILCLRVPMATFFSWSPEEQTSALQGFEIRSESLNLMKAQIRYGKLESSAHPGIFSQHSWPAASEIVAAEAGSDVKDAFSYFPPASEIANSEFEGKPAQKSADVPPMDTYSDLYQPGYPDPIFQNHSAGQGKFTWNGVPNDVCWPNDENQLPKLPPHAKGPKERPDWLEENDDYCTPVDVHSILQQFIQRRKDGGQDLKQSVTEPELFCDSFKFLNNELYRARSCKNKPQNPAEYAADGSHVGAYSTSRREATDELVWAPMPKTPAKKNISALEQFRLKRRVAPALRSQNKKLRPALPSNRSRDDGPSVHLKHSLKISRNSCYKSNPRTGRSI